MEFDLLESRCDALQKHINFHESSSDLENLRADFDLDRLVYRTALILYGNVVRVL